jgi:hypothetical protein
MITSKNSGERTSMSRAIVKTGAGASPKAAIKEEADLTGSMTLNEAEHRHAMIAESAYLRAEQRHFEPGHDVEDWLAAEGALDLQQSQVNVAPSY